MPRSLVWGMNDHQGSWWVLIVVTRTHRQLAATFRQSLRQAPRRKAAVHSRWCALCLARFDKSLLGEGVKNNWFWHTKIIL